MKALILEDESMAAKRLVRLLEEIVPSMEIDGIYNSIEETKDHLLNSGRPDVLFLDIHVLDGNSMELFKLVKIESKVIFTTAYDEFAVEAFRKNAVDYLLKPIKKDQLEEALEKVLGSIQVQTESNYKNHLLAKFAGKVKQIAMEDIAYFQSKDKICYLFLSDGTKIATDFKLQDLEPLLNPSLFYRINRQYITSRQAIDQLISYHASRYKVSLVPPIDDEIVISTEKTRDFKKWLNFENS